MNDELDICDKCGKPIQPGAARYVGGEIRGLYQHAERHDWRSGAAKIGDILRNVGIDCRWSGTYQPPTKAARAAVLWARIESALSPCAWSPPTSDANDFRFE